MPDDFASAFDSIQLPVVVASSPRAWALVEIFGHRRHWGEIFEVEAFGTKLLEVRDVDTDKVHRYGGASIFSLTMLTQAEMDEHMEYEQRRKKDRAEYEIMCEARRIARAMGDDDERPF